MARVAREAMLGLVFLVAALAVAPADAAPPEGAGALFFTSTIASEITAAATVAQCGSVPTYAMAVDAPQGAASSKAYTAGSSVAIACAASFQHVATAPFALSGEATVHLFLGCDYPTVFRTGQAADNAQVPPTSVRVALFKDATEISRVAVYLPAPTVCKPGDVIDLELAGLATNDAAFDVGDVLRLEIPVFSSNPKQAANNVHFLVGSTNHPTAFHAVGLPEATPGTAVEGLGLSAPATTLTVEAGSDSSLDLTVENSGSENASFSLSVAGAPDGLDISVEPASGDVEAGASASAVLRAAADASMASGSHVLLVTVTGSQGGNASLDVTVEIVAEDSSEASGDESGGNDTDDTETSAVPAGDNETGGESVPGPPALLTIATMASGLLVAVLRRKRGE